jgi:hypothetical protein
MTFFKAKAKEKAMKVLLKSGDTEKIIFFASKLLFLNNHLYN